MSYKKKKKWDIKNIQERLKSSENLLSENSNDELYFHYLGVLGHNIQNVTMRVNFAL